MKQDRGGGFMSSKANINYSYIFLHQEIKMEEVDFKYNTLKIF